LGPALAEDEQAASSAAARQGAAIPPGFCCMHCQSATSKKQSCLLSQAAVASGALTKSCGAVVAALCTTITKCSQMFVDEKIVRLIEIRNELAS